MARFMPIEEWPGSILYSASHGRLYCAVPRGLIPEYPYSMAALRPPNAQEQREWGPGVLPRMVVDVTEVPDLGHSIAQRTLHVAPWNAYLVLRLPTNMLVVAYRLDADLPRLDKAAAVQVVLASGHDVSGWSSEVIEHFAGERWHFSPPRSEPVARRGPLASLFSS